MPHPSESSPRPPGDFADALATTEPVLLVGGQAVNLWALYYQDRTKELAPFVSRDVDVLGDRQTLTDLADVIGTKPQFFPLKPPSNEIGVVLARDHSGQAMLVEVLRNVHGVTNQELRDSAFEMAIGSKSVRVRVPSPIALLKAKIANASDLPQAGRQDARHVLILAELMPAFLDDLASSVRQNRLTERALMDHLERLLTVVTSAKARRVFAALKIFPAQLFREMSGETMPKLESFLSKRIPRIFGNIPPG